MTEKQKKQWESLKILENSKFLEDAGEEDKIKHQNGASALNRRITPFF